MIEIITDWDRSKRELSRTNYKERVDLIDHLKLHYTKQEFLFDINVKLLKPVFSGSIINYHVFSKLREGKTFEVSASVSNRTVAKGEIICR